MIELRQSTAINILVGCAVDDTDGKTPETAIDVTSFDCDLYKGATKSDLSLTAAAGNNDCVHVANGYYNLELTASNVDTLGSSRVTFNVTGVMPFWEYFKVVTQNYWDSKYSTDKLEVDVAQWLGTAAATPTVAGIPEVDVTHWLGTGAATPTVAGVPEIDLTHIGGVAQSATDLKDLVDTGYDPSNHKIQSDLIYIHGSALTETSAGYLAAAFKKLFDVTTPVFTSESVNQSANNNTILAHADYGNAKLVRSTTPANALDVSGTGEAGLDFDNIKNASGAHTLTNITVPTVSALTGKTGFSLLSTGADLILKNSTFALAIADATWDEVLIGATHNIASSAGKRVRQIGAYAIHDGTAQAGNSVQITLAATASAIDGTYNRNLVVITGGTGIGQTRTIIDYDGSTKIAIADREWRTNPDATSEYQIVADDTPLVVDQGIAQAGSTSSTIKLRAYASATNDIYLCNIVIIVAGTGRGQARLVGSYDGSSKVVTICGDNWITTPDDTSVYVMIPYGATCASCINDNALAQFNAEMDSVLDTAIPGSPTADSINERIKTLNDDWDNGGRLDLLLDACALEATVAALNNISASDVNSQVVDVLKTDTTSEMSQGAPPATPTFEEMVSYLYFTLRNKRETTDSEDAIYDNAGTTKLFKSTLDDDGTTFSKTEYGSGA